MDQKMKFNPELLLANIQYLDEQMGYCAPEVDNYTISIRLPLGYSITLSEKGLRPHKDGYSMLDDECKFIQDAFEPIREDLQTRLNELSSLPCLQN